MSWFRVEKIDNRTFAISEYGHWEQVHSYLLIGSEYSCLIDTGLGVDNIKNITDSLTDLPIKVITTHVHWDHTGGHNLFDEVYVHRKDSDWLRNGIPILLNIIRNYISGPVTKKLPENFNFS